MAPKKIKWLIIFCSFLFTFSELSFGESEEDWVKVEKFSSFSKAVSMAKDKTLVISKPVVLDADIIIPPNTHLLFLKGGLIVKKSSYTLQINGSITAPIVQIFSGFSPGDITFGSAYIKEVYPQWWGAKGDGQTDDTLALQCAVDSQAHLIYLLKGKYLLTKTLNLTNRQFGQSILGQGMSEDGSIIIANTGNIAIDATGSRYLHLENFRIQGGKENPSTVGILFARSTTVKCVEFNNLQNVAIWLPSKAEANNGNGTVGIYNNAAELWRARNIYIKADNPVVFTSDNLFKIESPFVKRYTPYTSMSECTIDGASTFHAYLGPAITLESMIGIEILNAYIARSGSGNFFPYAIKILGWRPRNITYTGHVEGFNQLLYTQTIITGLNVKATIYPNGNPLIYLDGTKGVSGLISGKIEVIPCPWGEKKFHPVIETAGKQEEIRNTIIYLYWGQSIKAEGCDFSGNLIYSLEEKPNIVLNSSTKPPSFVVFAPNGITFYGSVEFKKNLGE